ncbi:DUF2834 domain-containing protein [Aerosakkonema funiforme]|uniref:DUF2834 domain-containing protein n=1 Tax=Aerosakkonema funiforme FACHB-1375 TaxID=2949571 RepID=A0A926ZJ02_9CYAN|nr:DUF2834 domain-containing protein [Aerosakkonema funiforme]MBD2184625.1 DUF2834 domain-containing protein [Aerosakkonema funiforme FACHB-1375]
MPRKIAFWLLWIGFVSYAFLLAPPTQPDTWMLIKNLSLGELEGINPIIVSLFYIMGVWPMIYSCVLFIDGKGQKIRAWPFAIGSFGVGAFAVLPYLALREQNIEFIGEKNIFLKVVDSRWTAIFISLIAVGLVGYAMLAGDWGDFIKKWQTSQFIHVMSLDFCMLCLLFPALVRDDMARRDIKDRQVFGAVSFIPLFGALLYLCLRPPLPKSSEKVARETVSSTVQ